MPTNRPWVLALPPASPLQPAAPASLDYFASSRLLADMHRLSSQAGAPAYPVRALCTFHPLSLQAGKQAGGSLKEDQLLTLASGLSCYRGEYQQVPVHLVHAPATSSRDLPQYLSETYQATGIESLGWESDAATRKLVEESYAKYCAGRVLVDFGACAAIFAQAPSEYDVAARISAETGVPLFVYFPAGAASSFAASISGQPSLARGWLTRLSAALRICAGVVFSDSSALASSLKLSAGAWDEAKASDYSFIHAALEMISDHRSAVSVARWGEVALEDRRKAVGLAKSIEGALAQASITHNAFCVHSRHFCLCEAPFDLDGLVSSSQAGFDAYSASALREKLVSQPTLSGRGGGRCDRLVYCQPTDAAALKQFLGAFSGAAATTRLILDSSHLTARSDASGLVRSAGLSNRAVLLAETEVEARVRMQSACDLIVVASTGPARLEDYAPALAACKLSRQLKFARPPVMIAAGSSPHFLGEVTLPATQPADERSYSKAISAGLVEAGNRSRLDAGVKRILSEQWDTQAAAAAVSEFIRSSATNPSA